MKLSLETLVISYNATILDSNIWELNCVISDLQKHTKTEMRMLPISAIREILQGEILRLAIAERRADIILQLIMPRRGNAWRRGDDNQAYGEAKSWLRMMKPRRLQGENRR